jgi:hypothetical protein
MESQTRVGQDLAAYSTTSAASFVGLRPRTEARDTRWRSYDRTETRNGGKSPGSGLRVGRGTRTLDRLGLLASETGKAPGCSPTPTPDPIFELIRTRWAMRRKIVLSDIRNQAAGF